jgi:uroporphyrin-III C-methyltransferase
MPGKVAMIGAGPGAVDLLTVRAARLLGSAQVVLHDDLVSQEILALCSPAASVINVGKRCGHHGYSQRQINDLMIQHARQGRSVVRLKSGDPSVFGRLGEELDALRETCVPFEIVPGITAAAAAATAAELTLTDRRSASALLVLTGHNAGDQSPRALFDPDRTTVAVYMPGPDYGRTAQELLNMGVEASTPCVVVSNASRPGQQVRALALGDLGAAQGILAPAVLIVGRVAQKRESPELQSNAGMLSGTYAGLGAESRLVD